MPPISTFIIYFLVLPLSFHDTDDFVCAICLKNQRKYIFMQYAPMWNRYLIRKTYLCILNIRENSYEENWSNSTSTLYIFMYTAADTFLYESFVVLFYISSPGVCMCKTREFLQFFHISIFFFFQQFFFFCKREKRYQSNLNTKYTNSVPRDIVFIIKFIWMFIWNHLNNSYYFVQFPYTNTQYRTDEKSSFLHIQADAAQNDRPEKKKKIRLANFALPKRLTK